MTDKDLETETFHFQEDVFPAEWREIQRRRTSAKRLVEGSKFQPEPAEACYTQADVPPAPRPSIEQNLVGLACSGGGIRSAAFSLGVVQHLLKDDKFFHVDYISTVSGGGYLGSLISSLMQKTGVRLKQLLQSVDGGEPPPATVQVRNRSNYLLPSGLSNRLRLPGIFLVGLCQTLLLFLPLIVLLVFSTEVFFEITGTFSVADYRTYLPLVGTVPLLFVAIGRSIQTRLQSKPSALETRDKADRRVGYYFLLALVSLVLVPGLTLVEYLVNQEPSALFLRLLKLWGEDGWEHWPVRLAVACGVALGVVMARYVKGSLLVFGAISGPLLLLLAYLTACAYFVNSPTLSLSRVFSSPVMGNSAERKLVVIDPLLSQTCAAWVGKQESASTRCEGQQGGMFDRGMTVKKGSNYRDAFRDSPLPALSEVLRAKNFEPSDYTIKEIGRYLDSTAVCTSVCFNGSTCWFGGQVEWESGAFFYSLERLPGARKEVESLPGFTSSGWFSALSTRDESTLTVNVDFRRKGGARYHEEGEGWFLTLFPFASPSADQYSQAGSIVIPQLAMFARSPSAEWWFYILGVLIFVFNFFFVNINRTSLHPFYRDSLSRTFLLKPAAVQGDKRILLESSDRMKLSELRSEGSAAPYHLINAALNLQGCSDESLRDRKTVPFLFSKRFCGSEERGYCPTKVLEGADSHLDLATAMAISAAAAAPNMGRIKSGASVLMALLNVRLGYWLPNPVELMKKTKRETQTHLETESESSAESARMRWARPRLIHLMTEAFGVPSDGGALVNCSDGGHVENLGVYELLRRRSRVIICIDGEADPEFHFNGLSTLQSYARVELYTEIVMHNLNQIKANEDGQSASHHALGRITYPDGEKAILLYIKLSRTGDEPQYLELYHQNAPAFPHESTSDQFFGETQFEVYRALGEHAGDTSSRALRRDIAALQVEHKDDLAFRGALSLLHETFCKVHEESSSSESA